MKCDENAPQIYWRYLLSKETFEFYGFKRALENKFTAYYFVEIRICV